ncbi:rRNA-processing protein fcf2 [Harmonia axyridis]|uniref:rRNA-processing protein fcf2 n=1 Tax=Harmonia axyridis TaxID=115357 RepID=UPI001E276DEA|nr:rRNA-processing protein fcf2 [Harmonia axyridis]
MDFVIDTYEDSEDANSDDNLKPSRNSMDFEFVTDEGDEEDILENEESETEEKSEVSNIKSPILQKEEDLKKHPLAHLFDEVELTVPKVLSKTKKSFIGFDSNNKNETLGDEKNQKSKKKPVEPLSKKLLSGLTNNLKKQIIPLSIQNKKNNEIDKLLEKSELLKTNMYEEPVFFSNPRLSKRKVKKLKKEEKDKTKGDKWFGLPATEVTDEVKRDLEVMQMRSVLDPKHFYKKNHMKVLPKYFQIGQVQDSPLDYYNSRLTKKERKKTLVDELMADAQFQKYNKNKYAEILKERQKTNYKEWRQAKRKNNKKK